MAVFEHIDDVTILIKTFERPDCLSQILTSIRYCYEKVPIIVLDDSKEPYAPSICEQYDSIDCIVTRYDVGVSHGRNLLLEKVKTKYFVLCDDDILFFDKTDLFAFKQLLDETDIELIGGIINDKGESGDFDQPTSYAGNFVLDKSTRILKLQFIETHGSYTKCDIVHNFFMAETEAIRKKTGGWDRRFKTIEHEDFFYKAKSARLVTAFTPLVSVNHTGARPEAYTKFRSGRRGKYYLLLFKKWNLKGIGWTNGWPTVTKHQVMPGWYKKLLKNRFIPWNLFIRIKNLFSKTAACLIVFS